MKKYKNNNDEIINNIKALFEKYAFEKYASKIILQYFYIILDKSYIPCKILKLTDLIEDNYIKEFKAYNKLIFKYNAIITFNYILKKILITLTILLIGSILTIETKINEKKLCIHIMIIKFIVFILYGCNEIETRILKNIHNKYN